MNKLLFTVLFFGGLFFWLGGCSTEVAGGSSEETNSIAGVLTDRSGSPLARVAVQAQLAGLNENDTTVYTDTTDGDGAFALHIVTQGEYGVSAQTDSSAFYSTVTFAGTPVDVSGRLGTLDSLSGEVLLRPDSAAAGAVVSIPGSPWSATTDSSGAFTLRGIPGGEYYVAVRSPSPNYVMNSYYWVSLPVDTVAVAGEDSSTKSTGPVSSTELGSSTMTYVATVALEMTWVLPLSPEYAVAGYWPMDYLTSTGTSSGSFNDARGFTGVATVYGGASLDSARTGHGMALALEDASQFAVIENDNGVIDSAKALTVEAWVYVEDLLDSADTAYSKNIFGKLGFSDTAVFSLAVVNGMCGASEPSFAFFLSDGSGTGLTCENAVIDDKAVETGKWIYLVAVWDGSSVALYRDGTLAGSVSTGISRLSAPSDVALYFGKEDLNVRLDEVRWSTTAITAADVFYRYNE